MGISFSVTENTFQFRDIYRCIKDSDSIENALKTIFFESCYFRIEDYYDHGISTCSYESNNNEFKMFLSCLTCKVGPFCPFCYSMGGHRKHKTQKEMYSLKSCNCNSKNNKCNQHTPNNNTTTTTTTTTNSLSNSTNSTTNSSIVNLETNFKEVKKEIHLFFRYILIFLLEKPNRPIKRNNNQSFSVYYEILQFLNNCSINSKYLAHVISQEIQSTNVDLERDETISLVDLITHTQYKSDIRHSIPLEIWNAFSNEKEFIPPPLQNSTMGTDFIKRTDITTSNGGVEKQKLTPFKDTLRRRDSNYHNFKSGSYLERLVHEFSADLKGAHIDLLGTLIDRDHTFKILFYRHFFNIHDANINPNDRFALYFIDTFYNDSTLVTLWVERSNLIKNLILASDAFENHGRKFTPFKFLPDIIRSNRKAAVYFIRRDLQKLTTHCINVEEKYIVRNTKMSHTRIKIRFFAQNVIFLFLYVHRQSLAIDIQQYFNFYVESLEQWKPMLSLDNESQQFDFYDCFPLLLAATAVENENKYEQLKISTWTNVCKYSFLLARSYILSQTCYLTVCKRKPTSSLAKFPVVGVEVISTLNTLQILSLINFKKLLATLFKKTSSLFDPEEIVFQSYSGGDPTYLTYRFIINILESNLRYKIINDDEAIYHFSNLIHRGIDVPLDLGKSNSIFRHYPSKKIQELLNLISTPINSSSSSTSMVNGKTSEEFIEFDFIIDEKIHKSQPNSTIQNSLISDTVLRRPNHNSRTLNKEYYNFIDNYYCFTNIYHLEYYGFNELQNLLNGNNQIYKKYDTPDPNVIINNDQVEYNNVKSLPSIFKFHKNLFSSGVLKLQLFYDIIFRDLFLSNSNAPGIDYKFIGLTEEDYPSIISKHTSVERKQAVLKDLIYLCSLLVSFGVECVEGADSTKLENEIKDYINSNRNQFKPKFISPITAMLSSYTIQFNGTTQNHSIFSLILSLRNEIPSNNSSKFSIDKQILASNFINLFTSVDKNLIKII